MGMLDDVKKLSVNEISFAITGFLSMVAPGFLILYLFKSNLIATLDNFKLTLFALALTLPVISVNFLVIAAAHPFLTSGAQSQIPTDSDRSQALFSAMSLSVIVLYPAIILTFWIGLPFREFLGTMLIMQLAVLIFQYGRFHIVKKQKPYLNDPFGISHHNEQLACSKCSAELPSVETSEEKDKDGRPIIICPECGHKESIIRTACLSF